MEGKDKTDAELVRHYYEVGTVDLTPGEAKRMDGVMASHRGEQARMEKKLCPLRNGSTHRIDDIKIDKRRPLTEATIASLMDSIQQVGLLHPIIVSLRKEIDDEGDECEQPYLVAGRHRMEALRRLGLDKIDAIEVESVDAELMEISENLHRAELTVLQRDEQVARWIELTKAKQEADEVLRQPDAKPGRPEGGVRAAARDLGISEPSARRAVKVAALSAGAKAAAVETGLANNRTALLAAARHVEPDKQIEAISAHVKVPERVAASTDADRKGGDKQRYQQFMAAFAKIEPLLLEIEDSGYDDEDDEIEHPFAYDGLSYLQIAERYKAVIGFDFALAYDRSGKGVATARRRILGVRETLFNMLGVWAAEELAGRGPDVPRPDHTATADDFDPDRDVPTFLKKTA